MLNVSCISGYLPTGTTIQALEGIQKFGIGALKRVFLDANPKLQVSKIFFLHSFTDAFPDKLIQCLNGVLTNYQSAVPNLKRKLIKFLQTENQVNSYLTKSNASYPYNQ
jgi:hypothetical protein